MFSRIAQRSHLLGRALLAPCFQAVVIKNCLGKSNIYAIPAVRNLASTGNNFKENSTFKTDSGEKLVPLKDVFRAHRDDIEVFRQDKPEVYKLLKHILESDVNVMKAQPDASCY